MNELRDFYQDLAQDLSIDFPPSGNVIKNCKNFSERMRELIIDEQRTISELNLELSALSVQQAAPQPTSGMSGPDAGNAPPRQPEQQQKQFDAAGDAAAAAAVAAAKTLSDQVSALEAENSVQAREIQRLQRDDENSRLKSQISQLEAEIQELNDYIQKLSQRAVDGQKEAAEPQKQPGQRETSALAAADTATDEDEPTFDELNQQYLELQEFVSELQVDVNKSKKALSEAQQASDELRRLNGLLAVDIDNLSVEKQELLRRNNELYAELGEAMLKSEEAEAREKLLAEELSKHAPGPENEQQRLRIAQLEDEKQQADIIVANLRQANERLTEEIQQLNTNSTSLEQHLREARRSAEECERRLVEQARASGDALKQADLQIASLQREMSALNDSNLNLEKFLHDSKSNNERDRGDNQELQFEITELSEELADQKKENQATSDENTALKQKITSVENKNALLNEELRELGIEKQRLEEQNASNENVIEALEEGKQNELEAYNSNLSRLDLPDSEDLLTQKLSVEMEAKEISRAEYVNLQQERDRYRSQNELLNEEIEKLRLQQQQFDTQLALSANQEQTAALANSQLSQESNGIESDLTKEKLECEILEEENELLMKKLLEYEIEKIDGQTGSSSMELSINKIAELQDQNRKLVAQFKELERQNRLLVENPEATVECLSCRRLQQVLQENIKNLNYQVKVAKELRTWRREAIVYFLNAINEIRRNIKQTRDPAVADELDQIDDILERGNIRLEELFGPLIGNFNCIKMQQKVIRITDSQAPAQDSLQQKTEEEVLLLENTIESELDEIGNLKEQLYGEKQSIKQAEEAYETRISRLTLESEELELSLSKAEEVGKEEAEEKTIQLKTVVVENSQNIDILLELLPILELVTNYLKETTSYLPFGMREARELSLQFLRQKASTSLFILAVKQLQGEKYKELRIKVKELEDVIIKYYK